MIAGLAATVAWGVWTAIGLLLVVAAAGVAAWMVGVAWAVRGPRGQEASGADAADHQIRT
jgi:hypothetical protein